MKPIVKVIAVTRFLRVPQELCPDGGEAAIAAKGQDVGSDSARLIECAGRTCYDSYGKGRASAGYQQHILESGHGSVLEHASISFYIAGISRGCSHELVRHRAGVAISQRSTRYVDETESDWALHPLIDESLQAMADEGLRESFKDRLDQFSLSARSVYSGLVNLISDHLTGKGVDKLTARKQPRGAARGALGNALETAMVWTANIRALRNVIEQRANEFADAEIRLLANELLEAAQSVCPEFFYDYERVACPDGVGFAVRTPYRKV